MTRDQHLDLLMLLSAIESWALSQARPLPDYLHKRVGHSIDALRATVCTPPLKCPSGDFDAQPVQLRLTASQERTLAFFRYDGAVRFDNYGRSVRDDGEKINQSGAKVALRLVSMGLLTGRGGLLIPTEAGQRYPLILRSPAAESAP